MGEKKISKAVIQRLPRYYRYLGDLKDCGIDRISSKELSERMKVTASQIRQDLNNFGGFGQQGYGYNVPILYNEIAKILNITTKHTMIVIGAGNLGQAITNYNNFEKQGFVVKAMFDVNPDVVDSASTRVPVYNIDNVKNYIKKYNIEIAVLTIPKTAAIETANMLVDAGIKAIWNFTHTDLNLPEHVTVENVHLSDSLMKLSYNMERSADVMDDKN
ncbi:MAG TPA: redox-sensing transcriptional repressor Rex [Eubacterium sp.]|nr:redox-sensing transcriptional repressor Rex [Eubacterium sp.]HBZ53622.1 redox-sensing transcriptional repressor Rex [Eubacterium sp.]